MSVYLAVRLCPLLFIMTMLLSFVTNAQQQPSPQQQAFPRAARENQGFNYQGGALMANDDRVGPATARAPDVMSQLGQDGTLYHPDDAGHVLFGSRYNYLVQFPNDSIRLRGDRLVASWKSMIMNGTTLSRSLLDEAGRKNVELIVSWGQPIPRGRVTQGFTKWMQSVHPTPTIQGVAMYEEMTARIDYLWYGTPDGDAKTLKTSKKLSDGIEMWEQMVARINELYMP